MYAIKGGWIGQTFALATCNESGGRKARIRRSKEERKAMVESFIKTYQSSNDGKFPSLNLTHKEVGGSFYTVREIVRDIIQENRVLGPAKFNLENQAFDGNTRGFHVESDTMHSHDYLFQLEFENPAVLDHQASATMEMNVNGNENYAKHEAANSGEFVASNVTTESDELVYIDSLMTGTVGNNQESEFVGASADYHKNTSLEPDFQDSTQLDKHRDLEAQQLVYGNPVEECGDVVPTESSISESFVVESGADLEVASWQEDANLESKLSDNERRIKHEVEESEKLGIEFSIIEKHEVGRNSGLVEANTAELSPTVDIDVETFPLISATKDINTLDVTLKLNDSRGFNGELEELENYTVNSGNGGAVMGKLESMDKSVNVSELVVQNAANHSQASSSNGKPVMVHETTSKNASELMKVEVKDSSRSGETTSHNKSASLKTIDGSEERRGAKARGMELEAENAVIVGTANEIPAEAEAEAVKERKPTLDRINLESWEGSSKKSLKQERNPLFVFLKSLVSSFMKFLSE